MMQQHVPHHRRHSPGMTLDKIRAILWLMFVGDLLHLYVYYVGCKMDLFVGGIYNTVRSYEMLIFKKQPFHIARV